METEKTSSLFSTTVGAMRDTEVDLSKEGPTVQLNEQQQSLLEWANRVSWALDE